MDINTIQSRFPLWYLASMREHPIAPFIKGAPGTGKTSISKRAPSIIMEACKANPAMFGRSKPFRNFAMVVLSGPNLTMTGTTGYLWPEEVTTVDAQGNEVTSRYSSFTRAFFTRTHAALDRATGKVTPGMPLEAFDASIILVDEADKMPEEPAKLWYDAILTRRVGDYDLPPGCCVWFAGNRAQDNAGSNRIFAHQADRVREVTLVPDVESTLAFYRANGALEEVCLFVRDHFQKLVHDRAVKPAPGQAATDTGKLFGTPRSLFNVDQDLRAAMALSGATLPPTDETTYEEIKGTIGLALTIDLIASLKLGAQLPPYADIARDPENVPLPESPAIAVLACHILARGVNMADAPNVIKYVKRLPKEFAGTFVKTLTATKPAAAFYPPIAAWIKANPVLVALM